MNADETQENSIYDKTNDFVNKFTQSVLSDTEYDDLLTTGFHDETI